MGKRFRNAIIVQGVESGDGRLINEVGFRDLPLSVRWVRSDIGAHQGAEAVGVLESVTQDGNLWIGEGEYLDSATAADAAVLVEGGAQFFSADPGGRIEYHYEVVDADGNVVDPMAVRRAYDTIWYEDEGADEAEAWLATLRERQVFDFYEVGGVTQVDIPAFPQCRVAFVADGAPAEDRQAASIHAGFDTTDPATESARRMLRRLAAGPATRPAAWYAQQTFTRYTELTVTEQGQIMGHVAPWNACHRGFQHTCEKPDYQTEFHDFHTGEVLLDNGERMRVGVITHVDGHLNSVAEYQRVAEDPACQLGSVRAYADRWGIQVCGAVHPDVTPAEITRALAGRPSGDWRGPQGQRKLFAIAMVNTPGYTGYVEQTDGEVSRVVAAIPPPPREGHQPPIEMTFFDAPPSVITAACACEATVEPEPAEDCGCGGHEGACTCEDEPKLGLTPQDMLDIVHLDAVASAVRARKLSITRV